MAATRATPRSASIDALRGVLMIVMALDHASYFVARVHSDGEIWSVPVPVYDDALAFLTRFVSHLAAPGFFLLMGASMVLFAESRRRLGWGEGAIARHFALRGGLLVALQFLVENPAWELGGGAPIGAELLSGYFGVLYSLGAAMICCALLLRLPSPAIAAAGLAAIVAGEALLPASDAGVPIWARALLVPGRTAWAYVLFPLIPWMGVAVLGLLFGRWVARDRLRSWPALIGLGLAALAAFALVRLAGGFGNIRPVEGEGWIPFLNVVKYPPSIVFLLLTLGANLLLLGLFAAADSGSAGEAGRPSALSVAAFPLVTFGQAPLFFYVVHLYLYGTIGRLLFPVGVGIRRMYPVWLLGLAVLLPICWLFVRFQKRQPPESLWRLL